jgi:alpha-beta hydrolase superfamily lysophospholipase
MEKGKVEQQISKGSPIARSVSIRWLYGSKKLLLDPMFKHAASVRVPTLILNGTADTVSLPAGAKILYSAIGSKDKTVELFKGADHFLYHEFMPASDREDHTDGKIVVDTVVKWLGERITRIE